MESIHLGSSIWYIDIATRWWQLKKSLFSPLLAGRWFPIWQAYFSKWVGSTQPPPRASGTYTTPFYSYRLRVPKARFNERLAHRRPRRRPKRGIQGFAFLELAPRNFAIILWVGIFDVYIWCIQYMMIWWYIYISIFNYIYYSKKWTYTVYLIFIMINHTWVGLDWIWLDWHIVKNFLYFGVFLAVLTITWFSRIHWIPQESPNICRVGMRSGIGEWFDGS